MQDLKTYYLSLVIFLFTLGCGKSPLLHHTQGKTQKEKVALIEAKKRELLLADCPIVFPKAGLCAFAEWTTLPSADQDAAITLRFWEKGKATKLEGPYTNPSYEIEVLTYQAPVCSACVDMKFDTHFLKNPDPGVFQYDKITYLRKGEGKLYIRLKQNLEIFEEVIYEVVVP